GLYAPGGRASYPSTVLMTAIPARVAGVSELVLATPPRPDGTIPDAILAAAHIAGVDRVYRIGGAQAIAALAYGTASIPRVDLIAGPGNLYVTLAKKEVCGAVGIDGSARRLHGRIQPHPPNIRGGSLRIAAWCAYVPETDQRAEPKPG